MNWRRTSAVCSSGTVQIFWPPRQGTGVSSFTRSAITQDAAYQGVDLLSLTTLGTPYTGSLIADLAIQLNGSSCDFSGVKQLICDAVIKAVQVMVEDLGKVATAELTNAFLTPWNQQQKIGSCPVHGIGGNAVGFNIPLLEYYTPNDGAVGVASSHGQQALATDATWSAGSILMIVITFLGVFIYDALWKSSLTANLRTGVIVSFILLSIIVALFVYLGHFSYRGTLIHTGALFGTIMAFNVWFRIWPGQQKIIRAVKNGEAADAAVVKVAGQRSRHNTYMSAPLLWAMIGQHTTYFAGGNLGIPGNYYSVFWLIIIVIAWHIVFQCYKISGKVQGF